MNGPHRLYRWFFFRAYKRLSYQSYPRSDIFICVSAPRKRTPEVQDTQLLAEVIPFQLISDALGYLFLPAVSTEYPRHQDSRLRYLNLSSPNCSYSIRLLFPFNYPTNADTLILGDISNTIWIWSRQHSASTMLTPFHSYNFHTILL